MLYFPGCDEEDEGEDGEDGCAGTEYRIAGAIVIFVTILSQVSVAAAVDDSDETQETENASPSSVEHFIGDEFPGEDADFEVSGRADHDVCLRFFHTETQGEEGGGYHVYPEDFKGGEREDGGAVGVFEGEGDEEEDYLRDVGDEEVH